MRCFGELVFISVNKIIKWRLRVFKGEINGKIVSSQIGKVIFRIRLRKSQLKKFVI